MSKKNCSHYKKKSNPVILKGLTKIIIILIQFKGMGQCLKLEPFEIALKERHFLLSLLFVNL